MKKLLHLFKGLDMIIVSIIWTSYDFRSSKKKLKYNPVKKNYLKKVPDPTIQLILHGFGHMAVADCETFATWRAT